MRRFISTFIVCLVVIWSLVQVNAVETEFGPWETELKLAIVHPCTIAGFISGGMTGVSVGEDGQCYNTTDSGKIWNKVENNTSSRFGLDLSLYQTVFHCGTDGKIRISTNNGRSWEERADFVPSGNSHCRYISFCNIFIGWIAAPDLLGMTKDSGRSWTKLSLPEGINRIDAIALRTSTEGYLLDASGDGVLYITKDAGETWSNLSVCLKGDSLELVPAPTATMRFTTVDNGIIVINRKSEAGNQIWAAITKDGGLTWEHERVPGEFSHLFLARDGSTLTLTIPSKQITVLKRRI